MEYIKESESKAKLVILCGVDRAGKDTFLNEIDRQTKYKHMTMDRGPIGFQAYCKIFNKDKNLLEQYKEMEKQLSSLYCVQVIYLDCETEELIRRCKATNHEIIDFDYHKVIYEDCFNKSSFKNKIKVDTTHKHAKEIVAELIKKNIL